MDNVGYFGVGYRVKGIERFEGIKSASVDYPYRLGQLPSEGKIFGVAELMNNEDDKR